jgi:hypothetical protein
VSSVPQANKKFQSCSGEVGVVSGLASFLGRIPQRIFPTQRFPNAELFPTNNDFPLTHTLFFRTETLFFRGDNQPPFFVPEISRQRTQISRKHLPAAFGASEMRHGVTLLRHGAHPAPEKVHPAPFGAHPKRQKVTLLGEKVHPKPFGVHPAPQKVHPMRQKRIRPAFGVRPAREKRALPGQKVRPKWFGVRPKRRGAMGFSQKIAVFGQKRSFLTKSPPLAAWEFNERTQSRQADMRNPAELPFASALGKDLSRR